MISLSMPSVGEKPRIADRLGQMCLFKDLSHADLESIEPLFLEANYIKETIIFFEDDMPEKTGSRIYFVVSGCVKLVKYSNEGESTIVRLASSGEFFGVTSALTHQPNPFSAEALMNSAVLYLNHDQLKNLINRFPQIGMNMMCAMGEVLWFNYATHNQVVKKSEARVAKIILYHLKRDGGDMTSEGLQLRIQLPHDYIASMTGIAYEESVRIISRLKKQHECIKYLRGGKILVTNEGALRTIAQEMSA